MRLPATVLARHRRPRDEPRAVPVAHRRAVREQGVLVGEVGVGVDRDGGDLELAAQRALVERLDVLQLVDVARGPPVSILPSASA